VRQQANWFRQDDPRIVWFEASKPVFEAVLAQVRSFVAIDGQR
jgi:hypothetical protein